MRALTTLPRMLVYSMSLVLLGLGFGLTALAHELWAYALTVLVWTLGEIAFNAVGPSIVADIAPPALRGRYNGMIGLAYGAATFVAPLIGTRALEAGRWVLWGGCALACWGAALAATALAPALRRREQAALVEH
jgi:MFS family permease